MYLQLIKAPLDIGAGIQGCKGAPDRLYEAGLQGFGQGNVIDIPFDPTAPGEKKDIIASFSRRLAEATYQALVDGKTPIVLGGDHSIAIGTIGGIARYLQSQKRDLFVLWVDAHADFNTPETTPSGNIHGMPVAVLTGDGDPTLLAVMKGILPLKKKNIYMLGLRDVDPGEEERLQESDIVEWRMPIVRKEGVAALTKHLIDRVKAADGHLHISFDVDGLDAKLVPAVGTPVDNGLTVEEVDTCFRMIRESGVDFSCEIVEYNPTLAGAQQTADVAMHLMRQLLSEAT